MHHTFSTRTIDWGYEHFLTWKVGSRKKLLLLLHHEWTSSIGSLEWISTFARQYYSNRSENSCRSSPQCPVSLLVHSFESTTDDAFQVGLQRSDRLRWFTQYRCDMLHEFISPNHLLHEETTQGSCLSTTLAFESHRVETGAVIWKSFHIEWQELWSI